MGRSSGWCRLILVRSSPLVVDAGAWAPRSGVVSTDLRLVIIRLLRTAPLVSRVEEAAVERLIERCAGLDVDKASVTATVGVPGDQGGRQTKTRTFRTRRRGWCCWGIGWLASGHGGRDGVDRGLLEAGGAPRGSTCPGGGERTPPAACRSRPLKLGAARAGRRRGGWEQPRQRRDGSAPPDDLGPASKTGRCKQS